MPLLKLLHPRCQPITKQLARDHINGDDNCPDDMTNGLTWVSNQAEAAGISIHPISVKKNNNNKTKQSSNGGPTAHIEATLNALKNETSFNQVQQGSVPDACIQAPLRSETPKSVLKTTTNFSGVQCDNYVPRRDVRSHKSNIGVGWHGCLCDKE